MHVKDVMVGTPAFCRPETNLGSAAEILWNRNCGILPIVDAQEQVIGIVTDRDLSIAMGTRNQLPGQIAVGEVTSGKIHSCHQNDEISVALNIMGKTKVRRLLVLNEENRLEGILSMDDIVLHAANVGKDSGVSLADVVRTLKLIYAPQLPEVVRAASSAG